MTTLNDLLFPVSLIDNPETTNSEYSKKVIAKIDGNEIVMNYCSPRYNLLRNIDAFPILENLLFNAECEFSKSYQMNDDMTTFHAYYVIKTVKNNDVGISVGGFDKIYPSVTLDNSYNGMQQGLCGFGYFRMICSNGMVIPVQGTEKDNLMIKGKHTEKLDLTFGELLSALKFFLDMQDTFKKRLVVLTDRKVENYSDRVEEVLNATKIKPSKIQLSEINTAILKEAKSYYKGSVNDFLVYNGINAYIFKSVDSKGNKTKSLPETKRKLDQKVFDYISQ